MSQPNVFIKQSQADRYDDVELEHVIIHSNSNPSDVAVEDIIIAPDGIDDAAGAKKERRSMAASLLINKKAAAAAAAISVFGACAITGASIIGAEQKRQQKNALAAITSDNSSNSKSGKSASAPFCETEPDSFAVNCGDYFANETVVLTKDILCTDNVTPRR